MTSNAPTVDEFLAEQPAERRADLAQLRAMIRAAFPQATEVMAHGMPVYHLPEQPFTCAFNAQKNNLSLYVRIPDDLRSQLGKGFSLGKSCIRFKALDAAKVTVLETVLAAAARA